ncbi:MAG: YqiJ family protein [Mariprofundales bacterium]
MLSLLLQAQNLPFTAAIALLLAFAVIEGITMLFGMGVFSMLDDLFPDFDADVDCDADFDADASTGGDSLAGGGGFFYGLLGWLMLGKAPFLVVLSIFLTTFGLTGLGIQFVYHAIIGNLLPAWLATIPALVIAVPIMRTLTASVARIMPKEETSAVSHDSFVGKIAIIVMGTARKNKPAQARLKDEFGQTHYVLAEPENTEESFSQGEKVVLLKRMHGEVFIAIRFEMQ